ncbi:ABC transporter substrate-binding protein [Halobacterium hubeiense]|nr:ABC transporter substrate-binding protein [Halobacterium hubeiense]
MTDDNDMQRRSFLKAAGGTAAALTLAGCSSNDNGGSGTTTGDSGGGETTTTTEQSTREIANLAIEAEDDYTFSMELTGPFHQVMEMLSYSSFAAVPENYVDDLPDVDGEVDQSTFGSEDPVGTGPFQFESWSDGTAVDVTAFDDFHGEGPELDAVHWQVIQDSNASYQYGQNQNSDIAPMPTSQYDPDLISVEGTDDRDRDYGTYGPMNNGETANYLRVLSAGTQYLGFNAQQVEKPVRQAVAYVLNQTSIVEEVFKSRGLPATHLTPPTLFDGGQDVYDSHGEDYPYSVDEADLESARQIMEEAGYGPNNRVEITFAHQEGTSQYADVASLLGDQLQSVYIDISVEPTPWSTLLERGRNGNLEMFLLGWLMDYPDPHSFMQLLNPDFTNTSEAGPLAYTDWRDTEAAQANRDAWGEITDNLQPTDEAASTRQERYLEMEENNWEDAVIIPLYHPYDERISYDTVDMPRFGSAGPSRQKLNQVTKSGDSNTFQDVMTGSITTFDPIAATDTASGEVITQLFDGLMQYPNAEVTPEGNLATDYEVSDDYTSYTFTLKEGVTFHNGSEFTAQDLVYSWNRLANSQNSNRDYFLLDNLGVEYETEEIDVE